MYESRISEAGQGLARKLPGFVSRTREFGMRTLTHRLADRVPAALRDPACLVEGCWQ